jgi:asparagine synthase (glutamine-hydrolysing)
MNSAKKFSFSPEYSYGGEWHKSNNLWIKGYAFLPNGQLLRNKNLANQIEKWLSSKNKIDKLSLLNGRFVATGIVNNTAFILTDRIRSFPLFYIVSNMQLSISDNPETLIGNKMKIDKKAENQFLASGFTWKNKTLIKGIKQCPPSTLILFINNKPQIISYFSYSTQSTKPTTLLEASERLKTILENAMERTLRVIGDKPIAVPLTGGFDSRFLVSWLYRKGIKKIVTFTNGVPESKEFKPARKVAEKFGFEWHPIYHDNKTLQSTLAQRSSWDDYINFASGTTSMSYFQDCISLEKLKLSKDTVIIGGHFGGFIAGSRLLPFQNLIPTKLLLNQTFKRFFPFFEGSHKTKKHLQKTLYEEYSSKSTNIPYSIIEDIDFKERQSKFIANSCRTYDFYVNSTILPFTDNEIIDFFKTLPFELKLNKKLYDYTLKKFFFKNDELIFKDELQASKPILYRQFIKYILPHSFISAHSRTKKAHDSHNYQKVLMHLSPNHPQHLNNLFNANQLLILHNLQYYKSCISKTS